MGRCGHEREMQTKPTKVKMAAKQRAHLFRLLAGLCGDAAMAGKCLDNGRLEQAQAQVCGLIIRYNECLTDPVVSDFVASFSPGDDVETMPECKSMAHEDEQCPDCGA